MKQFPYKEGTAFAVPLRQDGYAIGVVARVAPKGKIILAYFFGIKLEHVPSISDLVGLRPHDAVKRICVGDLGLMSGSWLILGDVPNWLRSEWPIPPFVRRDSLSKRAWKVFYEDDPSKPVKEESVPYDIEGLETFALYGYVAAEASLKKLLMAN